MNDAELEQRAIHEAVRIEPYNADWPAQFRAERDRLIGLIPELLAVEHIGSTAIPSLAAKPIIDIMAAVASIEIADQIVIRLCINGYITSVDFNRSLGDRRWLMRQRGGHRTHHLHLVLERSSHWNESIRFRDVLRRDGALREAYAELKRRLAGEFGNDRDGYGNVKADFIASAIQPAE